MLGNADEAVAELLLHHLHAHQAARAVGAPRARQLLHHRASQWRLAQGIELVAADLADAFVSLSVHLDNSYLAVVQPWRCRHVDVEVQAAAALQLGDGRTDGHGLLALRLVAERHLVADLTDGLSAVTDHVGGHLARLARPDNQWLKGTRHRARAAYVGAADL